MEQKDWKPGIRAKHFSLSEEDGCIRDETGCMYRAQSKNVYKPEQKERQGGIAADDFPW